jgi:hypothetical protein
LRVKMAESAVLIVSEHEQRPDKAQSHPVRGFSTRCFVYETQTNLMKYVSDRR